MSVMHIIKVKNVGSREFDVPHNGVVTTIDPGVEAVVTWEAACGMFGDPNIVNLRNNPVRDDRYAAVRAHWNFHIGFDAETEKLRKDSESATGSWEAKRPRIEVRTVETNEIVTMLIDDPKGAIPNPSHVTGHTELDISNAAQVNATIGTLQDQVARLTAVLAILDPSVLEKATATSAPVAETNLDTDSDDDGLAASAQPDASDLIAAPVSLTPDDGPTTTTRKR